MADPKAPNADEVAAVEGLFESREPSLLSDEDGEAFIRQLAGEPVGNSSDDGTDLPDTELFGPAGSGELTEDMLLTALPEDMRDGALQLLRGNKAPAAQDDGGDLDDLLALAREETEDDEDDLTEYGAAVPEDIRPFLEDFTNEFAGKLRNQNREIALLKRELAASRQRSAENDVRTELRNIKTELGEKVYAKVAPQAYRLMEAVPHLAASEAGMRLAFENAALRMKINAGAVDARATARGGAVRRTTLATGGAPVGDAQVDLEGLPENIEQAARLAAAKILRSGEMSKRELSDLIG